MVRVLFGPVYLFATNCFYADGDLNRSVVFDLSYSFIGVWFKVMVGKYFEGVIFKYGIPFLNCGSLLLFSVGAIHSFFIGCRVRDKGCFEVILWEIGSINVGH
jgi:hypothetical protein